ncbi:MAG: lysophospholipid acyltransferase family protein [Anaerolineales bacterium]
MPETTPLSKPRNENWRPELTRLPELTPARVRARQRWQATARFLIRWLTRTEVTGLENFPPQGPALIVVNHLGDADVVVGIAHFPIIPEVLAKAELYDIPLLGRAMEAYGPIWVHRGQPDRRALRAALQALSDGRMVALAPEGRQSVTGGLEEGTEGAAYLALKAGDVRGKPIPIVPVAFTGTENDYVYGHLKRLRRARLTMTIGPVFCLDQADDWRTAIPRGTEKIMYALASLLPLEYRGVYAG